jgi:hypothetical protein
MPQSEEEPRTPPDAAAVKRRASILMHLFMKALATPPEQVLARFTDPSMAGEKAKLVSGIAEMFDKQRERIRSASLWEDMEESEKEFINADVFETTVRQRIDASWLAESVMCLLWALGYREDISAYDQQCDPQSIKIPTADSSSGASQQATLRPHREIERQRDSAELWHWRCRTHKLLVAGAIPDALSNGMTMTEIVRMTAEKAAEDGILARPIDGDFPISGKAFREVSYDDLVTLTSIATERHKALNWLCGYASDNRWSKTPTDT